MDDFNFESNHNAAGDDYFKRQGETLESASRALEPTGQHKLDSAEYREEHRKLLEWWYYEKGKQSLNRMEMAMDADFYDNMQWDPQDAAILRDRGQMPLVYNEVAPMVDWLIGTERRTRVDWRILPRSEDDVDLADVKTKVMKYVSDINHAQFSRSRAFADAVKVGVGWVDDGVRDDPTQDVVYSKYEDWRNVLWDSSSYDLDLSDARYVFRWRWVDEDIALAMFPDRKSIIRQGTQEATQKMTDGYEEENWYSTTDLLNQKTGVIYASGTGYLADARRRRIRLIECQYRKPVTVKVVPHGPLKGAIHNPDDAALTKAIVDSNSSLVDRTIMQVHVAVFTEQHLIACSKSLFRHNKFSLTPIWCYRRSRDRLPYGAIRRVRDIQQDLNKRASKALFMLNTNQVIMDEGSVTDYEVLREEVNRPDGMIIKKPGAELKIQRDTDAATGQIQMMALDSQAIQKSAGVSDENLGRETNAVSGKAISARQLQGSVVTTEPFDNLRFATQIQGEKQLSLVEQFYTEEKVIRLTGAKSRLEWVKINQPEVQPDGSVRFLNDITSSMADYVVSEQDYAGTMREVMFESINQLASRLPPEVSLRLITIAMDFSDLPNKDEIAEAIRKITGDRDPNKELTPEEQQQVQQQMQQQAEALEMQRKGAIAALKEQQAKVRELNARAAKLEAEAEMAMAPQGDAQGAGEAQAAIMQIRQQASDEIERVSEALRKSQQELGNRTIQIDREANTKVQVARIDADAKEKVAAIQNDSNKAIDALQKRLDQVTQTLEQKIEQQKAIVAAPPAPMPAEAKEVAPPVINIQIDAKSGEVKKSITVERDKDGNITGASVSEEGAE